MEKCFFCGKNIAIVHVYSKGEGSCKECLDSFNYEPPEEEPEEFHEEWERI
jgi:recombinational DNA repair protein (RecF pathway)